MQLFPSNFHPKRKQICRGSFGGGSAGRQRITPSLISLSNIIMNLRTVMMKMSKQMRTVNMMLVMTTSPNIQHKIKIKKLILEEPPVLSPQKRFFFYLTHWIQIQDPTICPVLRHKNEVIQHLNFFRSG